MPLRKESHLYAFLFMKCPCCHHGDMFKTKNPYRLKDLSNMPANCPICGQSFFPETGFYWGAMYMSYILTVLFSIINVTLIWLIFGFHLWALIIGNIVLLVLAFPLFFRYSRVIWLQLNVPFRKEAFNAAEARAGNI